MSIRKVNELKCDICGKAEVIGEELPTNARVRAAEGGWRFMTYQRLEIPGKKGLSSKVIDACSECGLPTIEDLIERLSG